MSDLLVPFARTMMFPQVANNQDQLIKTVVLQKTASQKKPSQIRFPLQRPKNSCFRPALFKFIPSSKFKRLSTTDHTNHIFARKLFFLFLIFHSSKKRRKKSEILIMYLSLHQCNLSIKANLKIKSAFFFQSFQKFIV